MTRYDRRTRALAACLSALAGFVDALGFIAPGGFFVSFMSGNSTRLGVGLADAGHHALVAAGLIGAFPCGVVLESLVGDRDQRWRSTVLALVAPCSPPPPPLSRSVRPAPAIACMALAMGAENAVFERQGEVSIGLTYMTGTLVKAASASPRRCAAGTAGRGRPICCCGRASSSVRWLARRAIPISASDADGRRALSRAEELCSTVETREQVRDDE